MYYSLNVLPFVQRAITQGPSKDSGMDSDLSHWSLGSIYIGLGLQGAATQTVTIDSVTLVEE